MVNPYFSCPLLERDTDDGECCDIQMVRSGGIKESILHSPLDREKAAQTCPDCPFNQLP